MYKIILIFLILRYIFLYIITPLNLLFILYCILRYVILEKITEEFFFRHFVGMASISKNGRQLKPDHISINDTLPKYYDITYQLIRKIIKIDWKIDWIHFLSNVCICQNFKVTPDFSQYIIKVNHFW